MSCPSHLSRRKKASFFQLRLIAGRRHRVQELPSLAGISWLHYADGFGETPFTEVRHIHQPIGEVLVAAGFIGYRSRDTSRPATSDPQHSPSFPTPFAFLNCVRWRGEVDGAHVRFPLRLARRHSSTAINLVRPYTNVASWPCGTRTWLKNAGRAFRGLRNKDAPGRVCCGHCESPCRVWLDLCECTNPGTVGSATTKVILFTRVRGAGEPRLV